MIERRQTIKYWVWYENPKSERKWTETLLCHNNYINFSAFQYRINGTVFRKDTTEFREAWDKERAWIGLSE